MEWYAQHEIGQDCESKISSTFPVLKKRLGRWDGALLSWIRIEQVGDLVRVGIAGHFDDMVTFTRYHVDRKQRQGRQCEMRSLFPY